MVGHETTDEIVARNKAFATKEAEKALQRMAACDHDWRQFSEFDLSGIYCPKCKVLLDVDLGQE